MQLCGDALLQVCSDAAHLEHRHIWAAAPGGTEQCWCAQAGRAEEQLEDFRDVPALPLPTGRQNQAAVGWKMSFFRRNGSRSAGRSCGPEGCREQCVAAAAPRTVPFVLEENSQF